MASSPSNPTQAGTVRRRSFTKSPVAGHRPSACSGVKPLRNTSLAKAASRQAYHARAPRGDYLIDNTRRASLEVDDADGVNLAILTATDVVDDREENPRWWRGLS
jgi:hypothetical protein